MVEKQEMKRAWKEFRPDQIVGIRGEIEDLITGKKDWVSTFFSNEEIIREDSKIEED